MNPVVWVHFAAAATVALVAVPLICRKVPRNHWYGVRIPASLATDEAWFEINAYGGRPLLLFGGLLAATAIVGAFVPRAHWATYNVAALVIIAGGLATFLFVVLRHAKNRWSKP